MACFSTARSWDHVRDRRGSPALLYLTQPSPHVLNLALTATYNRLMASSTTKLAGFLYTWCKRGLYVASQIWGGKKPNKHMKSDPIRAVGLQRTRKHAIRIEGLEQLYFIFYPNCLFVYSLVFIFMFILTSCWELKLFCMFCHGITTVADMALKIINKQPFILYMIRF